MARFLRFRGLLVLGLILATKPMPSISAETPSTEDRKQAIMDIENRATADAIERKSRSETRLKSERVPVNESLPAIEGEAHARRRNAEEIAWRAMALLAVALKGEGLENSFVEELVGKYQLTDHFSPNEAAFIEDPDPSQRDRIQFSWRYEAACTLLWALGYIDELGKPTQLCDVAGAVSVMHERSTQEFLADARLRPLPEILDEADLTYRYHWAVVDARINGRSPPAGLDAGVTMERHYALNWLIGYMDQEWDDITTDT